MLKKLGGKERARIWWVDFRGTDGEDLGGHAYVIPVNVSSRRGVSIHDLPLNPEPKIPGRERLNIAGVYGQGGRDRTEEFFEIPEDQL